MNGQEDKFELPPNIDRYLATLSKFYGKEGKKQLQEIIVNSRPRVHAGWSYDNWNGGTHGHALYLAIPESIYLKTVNEKADLQSEIREGLNKIHDIQNEFVEEVFFEMEVPEDHDWRKDSGLLITHNRVIPDPVASRIWDKNCFRVFLSNGPRNLDLLSQFYLAFRLLPFLLPKMKAAFGSLLTDYRECQQF